jgi:periplasmic protein CpxP/Spy
MNEIRNETGSRSPWRKAGVLALGAALVLAAGFGVARAASGGVMGFIHGHGHGGALAHDVVAFRIGQALDKVGATDAQRQQIKAIVDAGLARHDDAAAMHEQIHAQLLAALTAPTVDRAAIEAVRARAIAKIDDGSKDLAKTLGDVAEVLTPAQRAQLAELHAHHE